MDYTKATSLQSRMFIDPILGVSHVPKFVNEFEHMYNHYPKDAN